MFVGRRPDGSVYGTWTSKQPIDEFHTNIEELPDNHVDVVTFMNRPLPVVVSTEARLAALESRVSSVELSAKAVLS